MGQINLFLVAYGTLVEKFDQMCKPQFLYNTQCLSKCGDRIVQVTNTKRGVTTAVMAFWDVTWNFLLLWFSKAKDKLGYFDETSKYQVAAFFPLTLSYSHAAIYWPWYFSLGLSLLSCDIFCIRRDHLHITHFLQPLNRIFCFQSRFYTYEVLSVWERNEIDI
jgi:hypothetical protein